MDKIQEYYKNSLLADLCGEYKGQWQSSMHDKEKLLKLALRQQSIPHVASFAYQGKGITKDFVLKEYGDMINGYKVYDCDGVHGYSYSLYVDYDYDNDLVVDVDVAHVMWTIGTTVVIPQTKCPVVYISNRSKVHLVGEGFNSVKIYLFDESEVTLEDLDENSSVLIYKYSDDAKVEIGKYCLTTKVKCFDKQLKL